MPRTQSTYICQQCGYKSSQFLGRCPECQTWNSLVESVIVATKTATKNSHIASGQTVNLKTLEQAKIPRLSTHIGELDGVLGGGIVPGEIVLLSGDPGIGKSTLLTQLALNIDNTLYVAGEESPQQIKLRAERIKPKADLLVLSEVDVDVIIATIQQIKPSLVIIDSIQTIATSDLAAAAGSISQVRESSYRLQQLAKSSQVPIILVGHITKDGTVAGPKTLEHLVDAVLTLEGDPSSNFRILRANKNRFGATDEVGIFEMLETGMVEVPNPSELFLEHKVNAPGSSVVSLMSGLRPLLVEVQALVTKSYIPVPRRAGTGIDNNRLQLLIATLTKRSNLSLYDQDIFVNATGGVRVQEPAADLGICLAIYSSYKDITLDPLTIFIGEVGLLGEIRPVRNLNRRIQEAKKLGFKTIIGPEQVKNLNQAIAMISRKPVVRTEK